MSNPGDEFKARIVAAVPRHTREELVSMQERTSFWGMDSNPEAFMMATEALRLYDEKVDGSVRHAILFTQKEEAVATLETIRPVLGQLKIRTADHTASLGATLSNTHPLLKAIVALETWMNTHEPTE